MHDDLVLHQDPVPHAVPHVRHNLGQVKKKTRSYQPIDIEQILCSLAYYLANISCEVPEIKMLLPSVGLRDRPQVFYSLSSL